MFAQAAAMLMKLKSTLRTECDENLEVTEHGVPDSTFTEHTLEIAEVITGSWFEQ